MTVLPMMRLDSASLAPCNNYQIQFKADLGGAWENWNDGIDYPDPNDALAIPLHHGNQRGLFRLQHMPWTGSTATDLIAEGRYHHG